jgi:Ribosome recycling factor
MDKAIAHLQQEFASLRTGRAAPGAAQHANLALETTRRTGFLILGSFAVLLTCQPTTTEVWRRIVCMSVYHCKLASHCFYMSVHLYKLASHCLAQTGMLDHVKVEAYGETMLLKNLATVSVKDPQLLVVTVFDPSVRPSAFWLLPVDDSCL